MRFLNLLPPYRSMAKALAEAGTRAIRAEDAVRARDSECIWLREQLVASQTEALTATRALANFGTQLRFGFKIYPDAPGIPATPLTTQKPGSLNKSRRADVRTEALNRFRDEALQQWDEAHGVTSNGSVQTDTGELQTDAEIFEQLQK